MASDNMTSSTDQREIRQTATSVESTMTRKEQVQKLQGTDRVSLFEEQ
jgi:hypothetical protein